MDLKTPYRSWFEISSIFWTEIDRRVALGSKADSLTDAGLPLWATLLIWRSFRPGRVRCLAVVSRFWHGRAYVYA